MKKILIISIFICVLVSYFLFKKDIYTFQFWDEIINETNKKFRGNPQMYKEKKYQLIENKYLKRIVNEFDIKLNVQSISSNFEIDNEKDYDQPIYFQKIKIPDNSKVIIIGDIHSSLHSLFEILKSIRIKYFRKNFLLKKNHYIIFLGDFLDRGPFSVEILILIFILKLKNFQNVYITQGNHENIDTNSSFGFKEELFYNEIHRNQQKLFLKINSLLNKLPEALFIEYNKQFFMCCHGVFDVEKDYTYIKKFLQSENQYMLQKILKGGEISGYKWNDINMNIKNNTTNNRNTTDISETEILKYFNQTGISKIFKGHQDLEPCNICVVSGKENTYDLEISKKYSQQKLFNPKQYNFDFRDKNLLAFITSTATQSKNVERTSFLEIMNEEIKVHLI